MLLYPSVLALTLPPDQQISELTEAGFLSKHEVLPTDRVDELIDDFLENMVAPKSRLDESEFAKRFPALCLCEEIITALINPHEHLFVVSGLRESMEWELLRTCSKIALEEARKAEAL